jgi:4'-phosphopantetheinyl transferase
VIVGAKGVLWSNIKSLVFQDHELNIDTVEIWHGNITAEDAHYQNYWRVLDAAEQAHAGKLKNDLLRKRYVAAHGRLRLVLAETLNEPPEKISIKKAEHGKPYLADTPELTFNLSHSADALVIAVGWNCQLGVDMEVCKSRTSLAALVDKCFAEEEIAYWKQLSEAEKTVGFYRFWTRKEAFVKATGRGIALGLNLCVINPENQTEFLRVPADCGPALTWQVRDIALGQGVCGAIVTDKDDFEVRQRMFFDV